MSDQRPERLGVRAVGFRQDNRRRPPGANLDVPHVELDALHWRHQPDWGMPSDEEFLPDVQQATASDAWVWKATTAGRGTSTGHGCS